MSRKIYLHTPCDDCGVISYSEFYILSNGLSRQKIVREHKGVLLCQPCLDNYLNETDEGERQLDMFDSDG